MGERLDQSDAAVVGRVVQVRTGEAGGAGTRLLTVDVEQRVKGDVGERLVVRSPLGSDCDVTLPRNRETGLLLTKEPAGAWVTNACGVVSAAELVVAGGEPRGQWIKVAIGLLIAALVLLWARVRLRRGARPELPRPPSA